MHIYVHVPFCARRCSYCDFAIAVRRETPDAAFVAAIAREWRHAIGLEHSPSGDAVDTLYFGGGTPSRLAPASIAELVAVVAEGRPLAAGAEITLEANPDDITAPRAAAWRAAGINRVSLGVQSHDDRVLEWMHRTHRADQVPGAIAVLRDAGIANVSVDLIFALPIELQRDWSGDLERTLALEPSHVSLYGLTVEPHTPLSHWIDRGATVTTPDDRYADEYLQANRRLAAAGFEHYEVSNAGRPGFRSRHNLGYWSGSDYLGLGPSAHSFVAGIRRWNVREWSEYQVRNSRGEDLVAGSEALGTESRALEHRYLALRAIDGLEAVLLPAGTRAAWCGAGWAVAAGDRIRLTPEGWLRLDALVAAARDS